MKNEDWEYEYAKDRIYALEREKQIELEHKKCDRKPTIINIIYKDEKHNSKQIFRNNKKRI